MMDYQKKKLLTQSVSFIQSYLSLTTDLLLTFKKEGVLTGEEVSTIQKDDTPSGKVLELVCLLKRKDNRTYTRFLQVLDERQCGAISDLLRAKGATPDDLTPDPRLTHYLQSYLPNATGPSLNDLASHLILRQIHNDDISALQDQISVLQQQLQSRTAKHIHTTSTSSLSTNSESSGRSTPASSMSGSQSNRPLSSRAVETTTPVWDVPSPQQEMDRMLRQKDDIIKRREEEYTSLKSVLTNTQNDLSAILDLNTQYLGIIGQLNQLHASATPRVNEAMKQLERDLEESRQEVDQLHAELSNVSDQLTNTQTELSKVVKRENRYKGMLGLTSEASEHEVEEKIQQIIEDGSMRRAEVDRVKRELTKMTASKNTLEEKISNLGRDKEKIEFHMRQQELTMKKMKRMKNASSTIANAESMLASHGVDRSQQLKLPFIERPGSQISLASKSPQRTVQQYCVFCRSEYQPIKAPNCRMHFRPIRNGKWTCCKDDSHRSAGCLQVPHFYVEITADKKVFLTDGARYMEMT